MGTDDQHVLVPASDLRGLIEGSFTAAGLSVADAETVADVLVEANLGGIDSHGVERAPIYVRRVRNGAAGGSDRLRWVVQNGSMWRLDAGHALGPIAAATAADQGILLARTHGVGIVAVGRSSHFGAAGYYAARGARTGLISMVMSNAARSMAPHGGMQPFLGANPIAIATPLGSHGEFVLDMSTSIAARGRMRRSQALGEELPPGMALDADGRPTTDPAAALAGAVLPAAGPKGSGLAMAIALMVGMLAEADFDDEIGSMYGGQDAAQNIGHLFIYLDPARLADPAKNEPRAEAMVDRLHAAASDGAPVTYAGERQARTARERAREGVPVARGELTRLAAEVRECGNPELAARIELIASGALVAS